MNVSCTRGWPGYTLLMLSWPACAAESTFGAAFQALAGLGIVLALIAGASVFLKRFAPGRPGGTGLLKPIATVAVGPRERIVVVELGDTWMIVGVTATQITALHMTAKAAHIDQAEPTAAAMPPGATSFSRILARFQAR
ncbi:MAG: flagellar biosynthetic protein FliO [Burkholderiales bacterium]